MQCCTCFSQYSNEQLLREINKIIYYDAAISYDDVPGFIVGVIVGDSTYVFDFGFQDKKSQKEIKHNTIFELGGITKVFMANLVQVLVDEGRLSYDDDLNDYLKPHQKNEHYPLKIKDILTHTTGLPRLPHGIGRKEKDANNPYAHYSKKDLFEFYTNYRSVEKDNNYQYSHVSFALLEVAIENMFKQTIEDVFIEKLFKPLGMNDTRLDLNAEQSNRLSRGFNIIGNESKPWSFGSFKASVGMKSTIDDLLDFTKIQMDLNENKKFTNLKETHIPSENTALDKNTYIALGWHVIKKKHCNVVAHSGSTAGHRAFVGLVDETKTGVIILSNSENGLNSLGFHILRMLNNNWKKMKKKSS